MAQSANFVKGVLLPTYGSDAGFIFRVYDADFNFKDYRILHSDLSVVIDDPDAFFYENEMVLDHSPATLGKTEENISKNELP